MVARHLVTTLRTRRALSLRRALCVAAPLLLVAPVHSTPAQDLPAIPRFEEETQASGLDSIYAGEWQYMVGGGVATFDCSGDGFPDMMVAGGENPARFYINRSLRGGPLKFEAKTSGLELDAVTGAYPIDIDSDGLMDVVVLRVGETVVMRGTGDCTFKRANESWAFNGGNAWWTSFSAMWEHGATWPTLALGSYIDRNQDIAPWGSCTDNWLERPAVEGRGFAPPIALTPSYCALSMLFTDWNRSGTPSLRVSNDREYYLGGSEQLWRIDPGTAPVPYTIADGWKPLKIWGMGIASADVSGDGYPDYFLTSMADNKLQTLATTPTTDAVTADFKDVAFPRNVIAQRPYTGGDVRPSTAWHAQFEDVNNDGLIDLFIAKGNVSEMPDFATLDPNNLLVQTSAGLFTEVGDQAGVASMAVSRGAALPDFNLDGLVDLVVVNRNSGAQVWRNTSVGAGHWVNIRLQQDGPNPDAIGATLEVTGATVVAHREITVGGGHVSGQAGWWHVGLGGAESVRVAVIWPDGTRSSSASIAADGFYVIRRGDPPLAWTPGR